MDGPRHATHEERVKLSEEIARRVREGTPENELVGIAVYGSLARGQDGPFSDVELLVVLNCEPRGDKESRMWVDGGVLCEVDTWNDSALLKHAATVTDRWPLSHGAFVSAKPLHDPTGFFEKLRHAVASAPEADFRREVNGTLIGELREYLGKVRNALEKGGHISGLPDIATRMAFWAAMMIGLHSRRTFASLVTAVEEAASLPRPSGFDELARLTTSGKLSDSSEVIRAIEGLWRGAVSFAEEHGYRIGNCGPV